MPLLNLRMDEGTIEAIDAAAGRAGQTRSDWVREVLRIALLEERPLTMTAGQLVEATMPWKVPGLVAGPTGTVPVDNSTAFGGERARLERQLGAHHRSPRRPHSRTCTCYTCKPPGKS